MFPNPIISADNLTAAPPFVSALDTVYGVAKSDFFLFAPIILILPAHVTLCHIYRLMYSKIPGNPQNLGIVSFVFPFWKKITL